MKTGNNTQAYNVVVTQDKDNVPLLQFFGLTEADLTKEYPPEIKPARAGIYLVAWYRGEAVKYEYEGKHTWSLCYWTGNFWLDSYSTWGKGLNMDNLILASQTKYVNIKQHLPWRGLKRELTLD